MIMAAADNQFAPPKHNGRDARRSIQCVEKPHTPDLKSAVPKERPTIAQRFSTLGHRTMVPKSRRDDRIGHPEKTGFTPSHDLTRAHSLARLSLLIRVYPGISSAKKYFCPPCVAPTPPTSAIRSKLRPQNRSLPASAFATTSANLFQPLRPRGDIEPTPGGTVLADGGRSQKAHTNLSSPVSIRKRVSVMTSFQTEGGNSLQEQ